MPFLLVLLEVAATVIVARAANDIYDACKD